MSLIGALEYYNLKTTITRLETNIPLVLLNKNLQWCARVWKEIVRRNAHYIIYLYYTMRWADPNNSVVFQVQFFENTTSMDVDGDDYVLTPLQAEAEDPEAEVADEIGSDDPADETGTTADDYVQSLVTIESNWENGKCCVQVQISLRIFRRRYNRWAAAWPW